MVPSCGLRATDTSRHHVPSGGYQRKGDVRAPRNFTKGNAEVLRFGGFAAKDERRGSGEDEAPVGFSLADATTSNPKRRILSANDQIAWLGEFLADARRMLALRSAGHTFGAAAGRMGLSTSNIFARCKRLGLPLAKRAGVSLWPKPREAGPPLRSNVAITERPPGPSSGTQLKKRSDARIAPVASPSNSVSGGRRRLTGLRGGRVD
ncbi:hypothetical protein BE04_39485 [Sorangium cellulosum]|uniref:Uncharacterized protein n=1 Tax=Sorangium cellulosum TaxID=56 RepID=A0A150PQ47_SORCE|nr:hypothetical protein BE04_39485 [Sorangium cellulosum]